MFKSLKSVTYGNLIGITCKVSDKKKNLADQPSDTAMSAAFCRALASKDERVEIRGLDYLAEIFLFFCPRS